MPELLRWYVPKAYPHVNQVSESGSVWNHHQVKGIWSLWPRVSNLFQIFQDGPFFYVTGDSNFVWTSLSHFLNGGEAKTLSSGVWHCWKTCPPFLWQQRAWQPWGQKGRGRWFVFIEPQFSTKSPNIFWEMQEFCSFFPRFSVSGQDWQDEEVVWDGNAEQQGQNRWRDDDDNENAHICPTKSVLNVFCFFFSLLDGSVVRVPQPNITFEECLNLLGQQFQDTHQLQPSNCDANKENQQSWT